MPTSESASLSALQHPRFAKFYLRMRAAAERHGRAELRDRLLTDLTGRVIERGCGNGLNVAHYPSTVTEVLAREPDDVLRGRGNRAAAGASVPAAVKSGEGDALPADDESFDAAVACPMLCSVATPATTLAELRRVLRPGGQLRFRDHVRSVRPVLGAAQNLAAPAWRLAFGGCQTDRETLAVIRAAGFSVRAPERFGFGPRHCRTAHVLGRAER